MTQSVELLLGAGSEARVLADWHRLTDAGLASAGGHRSPTNRPHVTVAAVPALDADQEAALVDACGPRLPLTAYGGGLVVFGRDPVVLARLVVVSRDLLDLHAAVARAAGVPAGGRGAPGRWVPHLTLALRMPREQLPAAVALLPRDEQPVVLDRARRWDSDARRTWTVGETPPAPGPGGRAGPDPAL